MFGVLLASNPCRPSSARFYLAAMERDFSQQLAKEKIWVRKAWVRGYRILLAHYTLKSPPKTQPGTASM